MSSFISGAGGLLSPAKVATDLPFIPNPLGTLMVPGLVDSAAQGRRLRSMNGVKDGVLQFITANLGSTRSVVVVKPVTGREVSNAVITAAGETSELGPQVPPSKGVNREFSTSPRGKLGWSLMRGKCCRGLNQPRGAPVPSPGLNRLVHKLPPRAGGSCGHPSRQPESKNSDLS